MFKTGVKVGVEVDLGKNVEAPVEQVKCATAVSYRKTEKPELNRFSKSRFIIINQTVTKIPEKRELVDDIERHLHAKRTLHNDA